MRISVNQRLSAVVGLFVFASAAFANSEICVRNYLSGNPQGDVCAAVGTRYVYAIDTENPEAKICVLTYADSYCKTSPKEYGFVPTAKGNVCVVNFAQPPVLDYCQSVPELYQLIPDAE